MRTHFVPLQVWRPRVMVHEEGFVRVKGRAVTPMMVGLAGGVITVHGV